MSKLDKYRGIIPAFYACYDEEGNINTPEKAKRVIELGCYSVVVGSIITRPQLITKSFTDVMATLEK